MKHMHTFQAQVNESAQNKPQGRNRIRSRHWAFARIYNGKGRNENAQTREGKFGEDFQR